MPGENGLELLENIRKRTNVPAIFLSAKGESKDKISGLEIGADDYLSKPFEPKELLLRIKNILNKIQKPILSNEIYVGNALVNLKKFNIFFFTLFFCTKLLASENSSHQYNFFTGNFDFSDDKHSALLVGFQHQN